jgi:hypothetical protein
LIITIALPRHITDGRLAPVQQELLRRARLDFTDLLDMTLRLWGIMDGLEREDQLHVLMQHLQRRLHRDTRCSDYPFMFETAGLILTCLSLTRLRLEAALNPILEAQCVSDPQLRLVRYAAGERMIPLAELEVAYAS